MPFTLPNLATLSVNIQNLAVRLTTILGRYQVSAEVEQNGVKPSTLKILIARTNTLAGIKTNRKEQLAVFPILVNDLRRFLHADSNETDRKLAAMILLGALLHRYFRLIKHYETWQKNSSLWGYSLFNVESVRSCKLFIGVREALKLPADMTNFKENDLTILDGVTIVNALEHFQDYMKPKLDKYPHFKSTDDGANFNSQLAAIISEHRIKAASFLQLFNAILFLQSVDKQLQSEHQKVLAGLDTWFVLLKAEHKNFSRLQATTIEEHIEKNVSDLFLRERFLKLLGTPHIQELLYTPLSEEDEEQLPVTTTPDKFLSQMKNCNSAITSFTLVGGCSLILEETEQFINTLADKYKINKSRLSIDNILLRLNEAEMTQEDTRYLSAIEYLQSYIYQSMDIGDEPDSLTKKNKSRGVQLLNEFLETGPELNMKFFDNVPKLKQEVALLQVKLSKPEVRLEVIQNPAPAL